MNLPVKVKRCVLSFLFLFTLYYFLTYQFPIGIKTLREKVEQNVPETVIAMVSCGDIRCGQILNSIKSGLLFSPESDRLKFIIFVDVKIAWFEESLKELQRVRNFTFEFRNASFPEKTKNVWKNMFAPCSTQRLFFPFLLPDHDAVLYIDSDTLFLSPPSELFQLFKNFNESQFASVAPESLDVTGFYPREAKIPYSGKFGINAGVTLMNLTRMRQTFYQERVLAIYWEYKDNIRYADQDMINIFFHFHPENLHNLPCEYNYRIDFCRGQDVCPAENGIKLIHGNNANIKDKTFIFGQLSGAMEKLPLHQIKLKECSSLMQEIDKFNSSDSNCNKIREKFLRSPKKLLLGNC